MNDKDLRSQLEGLFSGIVTEPEAEEKEAIVGLTEAEVAEAEIVKGEPEAEEAIPLIPAKPEEAEREKRKVPPTSTPAWGATLKEQRRRILNILLGSITVTGAVAVGGLLIGLVQRPSRLGAYIPYFAAYVVLVSLTLARRLDPRLRATILVMLAYIVGIFSLLRNGPLGTGGLYLLVAPLLFSILVRQRFGAVAAAASVTLYTAFVFAHYQGWLQPTAVYDLTRLYFMLNLSGTFVMIVAGIMFTQWMFNRSLTSALQEAKGKHTEVIRFQILLEERADKLATANALLRRLTLQLQTAAQVSRAVTSVLDPDELLHQTVDLICNRFDLYYVGLFLLDEAKRWAVLRAGTGEAGRQMLKAGHRLQVGGESMVGWCTANAQARITLDVGEEAVRFDNPLLPETRSDMALPLISRGQVIGALTVQSTEVAAFSDEDIAVLQTMADQLAVAIDNARLFREVQSSLEEIQAIHRHYLRETWEGFTPPPEARLGYRYARPDLTSPKGTWLPAMTEAVQQEDIVTASDGEGVELAVPITLRGQTIGALGLRRDEAGGWTADDVAVVQAVAEQVALSLENRRLLEETRRRARREQIIREITTKMRGSTDLDTILQTTVQELAKVLGTSRTFVQLGADSRSTDSEGKRGT